MQSPTFRICLHGRLECSQLDSVFADLEGAAPATEPFNIIVDCSAMQDYTPDARAAFVSWHRSHRKLVARVGIVTDNSMWHVVIAAMSLASGRTMRSFSRLAEASAWLGDYVDVGEPRVLPAKPIQPARARG